MRQVTVQLPDALYDELESDRGEASRSDWIRDAIRMKMRDKPTFQVDNTREMMALMFMGQNRDAIGDLLQDASSTDEVEAALTAQALSAGVEKADSIEGVRKMLRSVSGDSELFGEAGKEDEQEESVQLSPEEYKSLKELIGGDEDE